MTMCNATVSKSDLKKLEDAIGGGLSLDISLDFRKHKVLKVSWERSAPKDWMRLYLSDYLMYTSPDVVRMVVESVCASVFDQKKDGYVGKDVLDSLRANGNLDRVRRTYLRRNGIRMEVDGELCIDGVMAGFNDSPDVREPISSPCLGLVILPRDRKGRPVEVNIAEVRICMIEDLYGGYPSQGACA